MSKIDIKIDFKAQEDNNPLIICNKKTIYNINFILIYFC